jgi:hypothetical protein
LTAVILVAAIIWLSFREPVWVIFSLLFLGLALNGFVFPTRVRVSETDIEVRRAGLTKRRRLSDIRRVEIERNGVFLSPFPEPSRLDNHRGLFLFQPPDKAELGRFLKEKCEAQRGPGVDS